MSRPRLTPGLWLVDRVMRSHPDFSVSRMTPEDLLRVQSAVLPDGGPVSWVLGRRRRGVRVRTLEVDGPHGPLPLRVYTPPGPNSPDGDRSPRPVVVAYHGGGFALGSARQGDWLCSGVAAEVGAVVVAVDYRLAPTHPFPAAVEDCWATLRWVHREAPALGGDPDRVAVLGDSAGGNLAAVVTLLAREAGLGLRHQTLLYPATDLTDELRTHRSYQENDHGVVLPLADLEVFHGHYVTEDADPADWRLSPVRAPDHSGLPPALVVLAGLDPLRDSGAEYAERLAAAGVPVRVVEFHRMPHGFLGFPYLARSARPALRAVVEAQRAALL